MPAPTPARTGPSDRGCLYHPVGGHRRCDPARCPETGAWHAGPAPPDLQGRQRQARHPIRRHAQPGVPVRGAYVVGRQCRPAGGRPPSTADEAPRRALSVALLAALLAAAAWRRPRPPPPPPPRPSRSCHRCSDRGLPDHRYIPTRGRMRRWRSFVRRDGRRDYFRTPPGPASAPRCRAPNSSSMGHGNGFPTPTTRRWIPKGRRAGSQPVRGQREHGRPPTTASRTSTATSARAPNAVVTSTTSATRPAARSRATRTPAPPPLRKRVDNIRGRLPAGGREGGLRRDAGRREPRHRGALHLRPDDVRHLLELAEPDLELPGFVRLRPDVRHDRAHGSPPAGLLLPERGRQALDVGGRLAAMIAIAQGL